MKQMTSNVAEAQADGIMAYFSLPSPVLLFVQSLKGEKGQRPPGIVHVMLRLEL